MLLKAAGTTTLVTRSHSPPHLNTSINRFTYQYLQQNFFWQHPWCVHPQHMKLGLQETSKTVRSYSICSKMLTSIPWTPQDTLLARQLPIPATNLPFSIWSDSGMIWRLGKVSWCQRPWWRGLHFWWWVVTLARMWQEWWSRLWEKERLC